MAAPAILDYGDPARRNDYIVGPVAASLAVVAIWEVTRPVRWANAGLGLWLVAAPWLLGYDPVAAVNSTATGLLLTALSLVRGQIEQRFGGGWTAVMKPDLGEMDRGSADG